MKVYLKVELTVVSIHQPGYLPWLGFFKKISSADIFVLLDDVQYEKNGWQNRNKIRTKDGDMWLTVPINSKFETNLKDVKIDLSSNWQKKHEKAIYLNYVKAKNFNVYWNDFKKIYDSKFEYLVELNVEIIQLLLDKFNIKTKIVFSSEFGISAHSSKKLLEICKHLDADEYLSGIAGKEYLVEDEFIENKIQVKYQNFQHPIYEQVYYPFYPNMAAIDLLYNEGKNAEKVLNESKNFEE